MAQPPSSHAGRRLATAMLRGWSGRCPQCGAPALFTRYLKMAPACSGCGQDFKPYRADDAPSYFTIFVVGHLVVPLVLVFERWAQEPPLWLHAAIWIPVCLALSLLLLPRIKGATIGALWVLRPDAAS
jgi:uncharacterized protein (DUF983 family)